MLARRDIVPVPIQFKNGLKTGSLAYLTHLSAKIWSQKNIDSSRTIALAMAAEAGRLDVCQWLIENGHEQEEITRNSSGDTVLHITARTGDLAIFTLYCQKFDFVLHWVNALGERPLHVAAQHGHADIVQLILDLGVDPDVCNFNGDTPLHTGAAFGHVHIIHILLVNGANPIVKNKNGFTPSDYASSKHVLQKLEDEIAKIASFDLNPDKTLTLQDPLSES